MPDHIFHIEHLTSVTVHEYKHGTMEHAAEAWILQDTFHTDSSIWRVFDEWFSLLPDDQKQGGLYRVVQPSRTEHGTGQMSAHRVKPSWSVESDWEPDPDCEQDEAGEADVAQVA
jgi:hypothetical protein